MEFSVAPKSKLPTKMFFIFFPSVLIVQAKTRQIGFFGRAVARRSKCRLQYSRFPKRDLLRARPVGPTRGYGTHVGRRFPAAVPPRPGPAITGVGSRKHGAGATS